VFVQIEDTFEDLLQIFSEIAEAHISIIDANNPGYYLHALPLFASFWNESDKGFNKIILAIVPKKARKRSSPSGKSHNGHSENKDGILVITNNVSYFSGSLNR